MFNYHYYVQTHGAFRASIRLRRCRHLAVSLSLCHAFLLPHFCLPRTLPSKGSHRRMIRPLMKTFQIENQKKTAENTRSEPSRFLFCVVRCQDAFDIHFTLCRSVNKQARHFQPLQLADRKVWRQVSVCLQINVRNLHNSIKANCTRQAWRILRRLIDEIFHYHCFKPAVIATCEGPSQPPSQGLIRPFGSIVQAPGRYRA